MIELDLGVIADSAIVDGTGKFYIWGEFRYIYASNVPARHPRLVVVLRFVADTPAVRSKQNVLELEIVDQDGDATTGIPRTPKMQLQFQPIGPAGPGKSKAQVIINLDGLVFPSYGDYSIHLFVNENHIAAIRFHVAHLQKKKK